MQHKIAEKSPYAASNIPQKDTKIWLHFLSLLCCAFAYIVCILATTIPLYRNPIYLLSSPQWISKKIIQFTQIFPLPADLALAKNSTISSHITNFWEFSLLLFCMFAIYSLCAFLLYNAMSAFQRGGAGGHSPLAGVWGIPINSTLSSRYLLFSIFVLTIIAGCIYVYTPGTLSEDVYLYANYGRIISIHHANPYFAAPAAFPQDPSLQFVYWKQTVSIYGPIWLIVSALLTAITGTNQFDYFLTFRIFALLIHLFNTFLIVKILQTQNKSARIIVLGTFLYACNPLVLFESCVGGHNDILVTTFILLGLLFSIRREKRGATGFIHSLPALAAFTCAVLVKLTVAPLIVLFIAQIIFKERTHLATSANPTSLPYYKTWIHMLLAALTCTFFIACFYTPFWLGHPIKAILSIFSSQPSSNHAFNSLFSALQIWDKVHPLPLQIAFLNTLNFWNSVTLLMIALTLIIGILVLWRAPTIRNLSLTTLAAFAVFLLTTNWFEPWYVIILISLAVVCLPLTQGRTAQALLVFAFAFSLSAFLSYYYNFIGTYYIHFQPAQSWKLVAAYSLQFILPLLALLISLLWRFPFTHRHVVE